MYMVRNGREDARSGVDELLMTESSSVQTSNFCSLSSIPLLVSTYVLENVSIRNTLINVSVFHF